jgi:hypothetical protein
VALRGFETLARARSSTTADRERRRDITTTTVTAAVELSDREPDEGIRTHRTPTPASTTRTVD